MLPKWGNIKDEDGGMSGQPNFGEFHFGGYCIFKVLVFSLQLWSCEKPLKVLIWVGKSD